MSRCACGAAAGPLGLCADYYHHVLAEEQRDPRMFRWHTPVVCAYLLQHPSQARAAPLDGQFRMLQLYVAEGLDALLAVARHQVARNRHGGGHDPAPLAAYAPLPAGGPPPVFRTALRDLPERGGTLVPDGHDAYGRHIAAIAAATVDAWRALPG